MLKNQVITVDGSQWKVREAVSMEAALDEVAMARCTGSVGGKTTMTSGGIESVISDVVRLNEDGTERQPS